MARYVLLFKKEIKKRQRKESICLVSIPWFIWSKNEGEKMFLGKY